MKKPSIKSSILVLILLAALAAPSLSQVTAQIGGGFGAVMPSGDYAGTPAEYYNGTAYGLSTGFNAHAKARVGLFGFILNGQIGYSSLSNSGDAPGGGTVENSHSIITLEVGPEFQIGIPALPLTPYVGANVQLNRFSGETVFKGISAVSSGTFALEPAIRVGLGVHAGVIVALGPGMKLDVGATYAMLNMFGKAWTDPQPTKDDREDSYGGLNDEKDPLIAVGGAKHFVASARTINAIGFTATVMFGL